MVTQCWKGFLTVIVRRTLVLGGEILSEPVGGALKGDSARWGSIRLRSGSRKYNETICRSAGALWTFDEGRRKRRRKIVHTVFAQVFADQSIKFK